MADSINFLECLALQILLMCKSGYARRKTCQEQPGCTAGRPNLIKIENKKHL